MLEQDTTGEQQLHISCIQGPLMCETMHNILAQSGAMGKCVAEALGPITLPVAVTLCGLLTGLVRMCWVCCMCCFCGRHGISCINVHVLQDNVSYKDAEGGHRRVLSFHPEILATDGT